MAGTTLQHIVQLKVDALVDDVEVAGEEGILGPNVHSVGHLLVDIVHLAGRVKQALRQTKQHYCYSGNQSMEQPQRKPPAANCINANGSMT